MDLTGTTLKERYYIMEKAGAGSSGKLYLARDMELGSTWAVKEIPLVRRQEARLLRQMQHPVLPRMVDYAELEESCCLVMEYVRGKTLAACLKEKEHFSYHQILELTGEILDALEYLHTRKPPICHADIKPENIMYTPEGKVKLVDFGSASFSSEMPRSRVEGTPAYAAPEQMQGYLTCQGDIYSLGKTLDAAIGRCRLFFHPDFFFFLRRCTRSDRKERFQNTTEAADALQRLKTYQKLSPLLFSGALGAAALLVFLLFLSPGQLPAGNYNEELARVTCKYDELEAVNHSKTEDFEEENQEETAEDHKGKIAEHQEETPEDHKGEIQEHDPGMDPEKEQEESRKKDQENSRRREICAEIEEELHALLAEYKGEGEQVRTLFLLAINAELAENPQRAALYYEQILLYHPEEEQAYASYGLFLLRQHQGDRSEELWEDYLLKVQRTDPGEGDRPEAASEEDPSDRTPGADFLKTHEGRLWQKRLKMWKEAGVL